MTGHLKSLAGLLLGGAVLIMSTAVPAAMHGKHKAAQGSLLEKCHGPAALPSPDCGRTPTPAFAADGTLWLVFSQHGHVYVTASSDRGETFGPPLAVNPRPEAIYDDGENRPKLAIGPDGELFVSWSRRIPGRYAGDVRFARSVDGGRSFEPPVTINRDRAPISHRFDSLIVDGAGRVVLVWIDKRDQVAAKKSGADYAGAALYYAVSDDRGHSFRPDRKLVDHSCECCRIALDLDGQGGVTVLWRHVYPVNLRDHAIARLHEAPIRGLPTRATDDGWVVEGCPHHGPDLAIDDREKAHLVWFSKGEKNRGLTYGRLDLASGRLEFQQAIDRSAAASRPQILLAGGEVIRAWKRFDGERTALMVSRSPDSGRTWSKAEAVAVTSDDSDHPQLIGHGDAAYVSWHSRAEGYRLIPLAVGAGT